MTTISAIATPHGPEKTLPAIPLVVDLDGTLLRSDTLLESLLSAGRAHPGTWLMLPLWLAKGVAHLKHRLAERSNIEVRTLPLNLELVGFLRAQKNKGRGLVLATGADQKIANAVAQHCGLFDRVMASDGQVNLTARQKCARLVREFGRHGFDYVGNSARDLPVWAAARQGLLVKPSSELQAAAASVTRIEAIFGARQAEATTYFSAMRPQHWLKNLLLLVPLVATHHLYEVVLLGQALLGAVCFSLAASGVYLLNDLLDLQADRRHPRKKHRALACGQMPLVHAMALVPCLWLAAATLAVALPAAFFSVLASYVGLMVAYSLRLKDIAVVDAFVLGLGYSLRILAGALAVQLLVSPWLLVCSTAMFFGLALLKRYAELITLRVGMGRDARVRAYRIADASILAGLGVAAGCIAVVLLALYPLMEPTNHARGLVWLLCGLLQFWIGHVWLMAHRGQIRDDPVAFALNDRLSRLLGLVSAAIVLLAT